MVIQFFIAATIFVVSVGHPFLVRLKELVKNHDMKSYKKEVMKTTILFIAASSLIIILINYLSEFIMLGFWGKDSLFLVNDLKISMFGLIPLFMSSVFIYAINSLRMFHLNLIYYPIVVISSIVLSVFLIPAYGISGGIWVIIITQMIRMVLSFLFLIYAYRRNVLIFKNQLA
jgi:O-antigen/teichoic acid export membrane protein